MFSKRPVERGSAEEGGARPSPPKHFHFDKPEPVHPGGRNPAMAPRETPHPGMTFSVPHFSAREELAKLVRRRVDLRRKEAEARALLEQHHAAGRETWIVSASPIEIVEPLAIALEMTGGIGTRGEVDNGVYTGRLAGPFCYGPGKAEAIVAIAAERNINLADSWSYSDSMSDVPMMEIVGNAVAVNPDAQLSALARSRGWPIVVFAQRSKMLARRTTTITAALIGMAITYSLGARSKRS